MRWSLRCRSCGREYRDFRLRCDCGGILDVHTTLERDLASLIDSRYTDIRRYLNLLPIDEHELPRLTLPITPLVHRSYRERDLFFKLDYLMPSGSFKDRGTYVTVSRLKAEGIDEVVIDSSGNAAISFALFGRSENLKVHLFIPHYTSEGKKRLLRTLEAEIHEIQGTRMDTHKAAEEYGHGVYASHWLNPYFIEGTKLIAYESYEVAGDMDYAIVPVGSGGIFLGIYKGFKELNKLTDAKLPRMIAVQAKGYEALCKKSTEKATLPEGIFIPEPPRKEELLDAIHETHGACISVGDPEVRDALHKLISMGFLVEPTSATVLAALDKLIDEEKIEKGARVLLPLTGSGLKNA